NVYCGGGHFGAAMNPAMSLSISVITCSWKNHWIYWLGPFVGAALSTFVYQTINTSEEDIYEQLPITKPVKDDDTYKQPLIITKP
ncbi:hypothetical protein F6Q10_35055, partial [Streptomyces vinaceus]|nr:hypothetical protein [Streptomyces vinaceus]